METVKINNKVFYIIPFSLLVIFLIIYYLIFTFTLPSSIAWFFEGTILTISYLTSRLFLNSYIVVLSFFVSISFVLLFKPIKNSEKRKIKLRCIILFILAFLIILPFSKGKEFIDTMNFGMKIVTEINNYKSDKGEYPLSLNDIRPSFEPFQIGTISRNFNYELRYNNELVIDYKLSFKPTWLKHSEFIYVKRENKFIGFD
ncbi:MAG: hypothetical protein KDC73_12655 [Ignavibacteriae bacterium]|nr:hypothetical protein [Ignavibacteriota bacterium]MCB9242887.1 hypothetical protein [Ignavibacteriales bacterium]